MHALHFVALAGLALSANAGAVESDRPDARTVELESAALDTADDAAAPPVNDPWERFNRRVYRFNGVADRYVARPIAIAYVTITPAPVQGGVSRFFSNLREPGNAFNQTLQGRPLGALKTLGRFVVNTTVGVAGVFDPATRFGMRQQREDFGQTLATWGWRDSRYLVLPLGGPGTMRDFTGSFVDKPLSPIGYLDTDATGIGVRLLQFADGRARLLPTDQARREALDEYVMVRDAWLQRRAYQIRDDGRTERL